MTAPQDRYLPPPQYQATPSLQQVRARTRRSPIDLVVTAIIFTFATMAGLSLLAFSLFFAMGADACQDQCSGTPITWAYLVTWGGVATAAVVAIVGVVVAAVRGRLMWIWPALASGLIVAAAVVALLLVNSVLSHG